MRSHTGRAVLFALSLSLALAGPGRPAAPALEPVAERIRRIEQGRASFADILPWLDTDNPDLQTALMRAALQSTGWAEGAAGRVREWLASGTLPEERQEQLIGILRTFSLEEGIQEQVARVVADGKADRLLRLRLVQCLGRARKGLLSAAEVKALGEALRDGDVRLRHEALLALRGENVKRLDPLVRPLARDEKLPAALRVAALECLLPRERAAEPALVAFLRGQMLAEEDLTAQAAARALASASLDAAQLRALADDVPRLNASTLVLVLPAFKQVRAPEVGLALAGALVRSAPAGQLSLGELDRLLIDYPDAVRQAAAPLRQKLLDSRRQDQPTLDRVRQGLRAGDARRGLALFHSPKTHCGDCHRCVNRGGGFGPNLSRLGVLRTRAEVLESTVLPGRHVNPAFRTHVVVTKAGRVFTGLFLYESTEAVHLQPAPGARVRIPREQIDEARIAGGSLMPAGFEKLLTAQELADLVELLVAQR